MKGLGGAMGCFRQLEVEEGWEGSVKDLEDMVRGGIQQLSEEGFSPSLSLAPYWLLPPPQFYLCLCARRAANAPAGGHGHVILQVAELTKLVVSQVISLHWILWCLIRSKCWYVLPSMDIHNISFPEGCPLSNKGHVHIAAFNSRGTLIGSFSSHQLPIFIKRLGIQYFGDLLLSVKFLWNWSTGSKVAGEGEGQLNADTQTGKYTHTHTEWYCTYYLLGKLN